MLTARRGLVLAGVALALALVAGRLLAGAYAEWAWYAALDAQSLWATRVTALVALRLGLAGIAFAFTFANLLAMRRSIVSLVLPRQLGNIEIGEAVPGRALTATAAAVSLITALAVALPESDWLTLVRAWWARPIGESDPYLQRDMSFWMGTLPFERMLHEWMVTLGVVVGLLLLLLYGLTPSLRVERGKVLISTWVRRHFAIYSAFLLLLVAWGYRLDAFDLQLHGSGVRETFVAFDHRVTLPYLVTLSFATAAAALLVAWTGWVGHQRATITTLLVVLIAGPVGTAALPLLDRRTGTERERAALDRPYLNVRVLYTRRAYRVDDILQGAAADSLRADSSQLATSVSGWDPAALARAFADEPGVIAADGTTSWRVRSDGRLRGVVLLTTASGDVARAPLAVREAEPSDADDRGAPWSATDPVALSVPALAVGESLTAVLPVVDTLGRIAAPLFPDGWRRVALAWSVRNLRLAASDADARRTRLLLRRDVRDRVQRLYPFFTVGTTPQPMVVGDSLWWAVELFNASSDYPLSEPLLLGGAAQRYAVSAGLALVNAHTGRVQVALPSASDKVTQWWRAHLPDLFAPRHAIAPAVLAAAPAPVDRATVQGNALARVGFRNDTLSTRPLFSADDADLDLLAGAPAPFVSGAAGHPLAWSVPAVDGVDRMRGAFVAVGGAQPATAFVQAPDTLRWSALLDHLQRTADSARMSRSRRHPRRGHVQVIPATNGLHVIQSFYDWPPEREPAFAGVVALHGGAARSGATLAVALGGSAHAPTPDATLRLRVARLYADLQDAQRRGDWAAFGRAMEALGRLVNGRP